jgi:hypothetical protein
MDAGNTTSLAGCSPQALTLIKHGDHVGAWALRSYRPIA